MRFVAPMVAGLSSLSVADRIPEFSFVEVGQPMMLITATLFAQTNVRRPLILLSLVETALLRTLLMFSRKLQASLSLQNISCCFVLHVPFLLDSGGSPYKTPYQNQPTIVRLFEVVALAGS